MNFTKRKRTTVTQQEELIEASKKREEEIHLENEIIINTLKSNKFDTNNDKTSLILKGMKGHLNFISNDPIKFSIEEQVFELTVLDLSSKFKVKDYFKEREVSEEAKNYYESLKKNGNFNSNFRFGIVNEDCDKEITCGSQKKSWGYRALDGGIINDSNVVEYNEALREGDTLAIGIVNRPARPRFLIEDEGKEDEGKEEEEVVDSSYIRFFVNGVLQDFVVNGLYHKSNYLIISLYNFAEVELVTNSALFKYKYI